MHLNRIHKPYGSRQWTLPCINCPSKPPLTLEIPFGYIFESCLRLCILPLNNMLISVAKGFLCFSAPSLLRILKHSRHLFLVPGPYWDDVNSCIACNWTCKISFQSVIFTLSPMGHVKFSFK